ncbi:MAG TPA: HemK2/MTQ2 family protein methyltransferase [Candidatus Acidoferrales bacterium]|nr:HemK2/MTQ2 family protein methyltransferase [Candidatus Acidoferrales bacterium]
MKDPKSAELTRRVLQATSQTPDDLYSPQEDTFLLLDGVGDIELQGKSLLDLGTGSGVLGIFCALRGAIVTVADIDQRAVEFALEVGKRLGVKMKGITSDLFSNLPGRFEWVLFNPPYLPSASIDDKTIDGGRHGTAIIERFLGELPSHLSKGGTALLVVSSLNDPPSLIKSYKNIEFGAVGSRQLFFEELQLLRARLRKDFSSQRPDS